MDHQQKDTFFQLLQQEQILFLEMFTHIDGGAQAKTRSWQRPGGGGGHMGTIRGDTVEKGSCNISKVYGMKTPNQINAATQPSTIIKNTNNSKSSPSTLHTVSNKFSDDEQPFFACGLSTICHMFNPHAPIAHLNVRFFEVAGECWFGGGADLTPCFEYPEDTQLFHQTLQKVCAEHHPNGESAYHEYKAWCDKYYYIKHRQEPRGVGGIFFDKLKGSYDTIIPYLSTLMAEYRRVLKVIYQRRKNMTFSNSQKQEQLFARGKYVEFNLLYDIGTKFGLQSGGDLEAIFVSLPPVVRW
ncbi:MAG: coproporphyrinogen III oxidase [Proteobacteria bacterium]|nr:coproporphyrinogen III oxidase [Pseudomonadota bacterium]